MWFKKKEKRLRVYLGSQIPIKGRVTYRCRNGHVFSLDEAQLVIDALRNVKYVLCPHCHTVVDKARYSYDVELDDITKEFVGKVEQEESEVIKKLNNIEKELIEMKRSLGDLWTRFSLLDHRLESLERTKEPRPNAKPKPETKEEVTFGEELGEEIEIEE